MIISKQANTEVPTEQMQQVAELFAHELAENENFVFDPQYGSMRGVLYRKDRAKNYTNIALNMERYNTDAVAFSLYFILYDAINQEDLLKQVYSLLKNTAETMYINSEKSLE